MRVRLFIRERLLCNSLTTITKINPNRCVLRSGPRWNGITVAVGRIIIIAKATGSGLQADGHLLLSRELSIIAGREEG